MIWIVICIVIRIHIWTVSQMRTSIVKIRRAICWNILHHTKIGIHCWDNIPISVDIPQIIKSCRNVLINCWESRFIKKSVRSVFVFIFRMWIILQNVICLSCKIRMSWWILKTIVFYWIILDRTVLLITNIAGLIMHCRRLIIFLIIVSTWIRYMWLWFNAIVIWYGLSLLFI